MGVPRKISVLTQLEFLGSEWELDVKSPSSSSLSELLESKYQELYQEYMDKHGLGTT